jgi:hypothetical protein
LTRITEWAGHAVKRTGWNLNPRAALSGLALVGGLSLLAAFYLALSSQTAVLGRHLQEMEAARTEILRENAQLRDHIARSASVETLKQRALSAGYVTTSTVIFVPVSPSALLDSSGTAPNP